MMKKSIVVSTPGATFSALAMKEEFKDSLRKLACLGCDAVELSIKDPALIDVNETRKLLRQYGLAMPAISTGRAYGEDGLSLTDPDSGIRRKAVQRIKDQMDLAVQLDGAFVIIGLIRGTVKPGQDGRQAERYFMESVSECLGYRPEITLVVEPINRYETSLFNDTLSVQEIIGTLGRPNLKMLVDTFHMNIEEPNMAESIYRAGDCIAHVHVADSNRWAPGSGHINFGEILDALTRIGYAGAISAEILPKPTPEESVRLTMECYRKWGL
jgi:sugar phosphate isomerase/epimerase